MENSEILDDFIRRRCPTEELWENLALEGNFQLIERLRRAELGESGFGTITVPAEGFSNDDNTHNLVLDWLKEHDINIMNVDLEYARLKHTLKDRS